MRLLNIPLTPDQQSSVETFIISQEESRQERNCNTQVLQSKLAFAKTNASSTETFKGSKQTMRNLSKGLLKKKKSQFLSGKKRPEHQPPLTGSVNVCY